MISTVQRECAACGKLFQPKGRERYCEGPHYKPCPVCGEMVIATYWSDPAKRCEKCRKANAKPAKPIVPIVQPSQTGEKAVTAIQDDNITRTIDLGDDSNVRKYIGTECKGIPFKTGHSYLLSLEKEEKYGCYVVTSKYDITSEEDIDAYCRFSSLVSFNQHFEKVS